MTTAKIRCSISTEMKCECNWTYLRFLGEPTKEQVQAAVDMTDGDYTHDGESVVIYHRSISGKLRTENIARALIHAGVDVRHVLYHGDKMEFGGRDEE